MTFDRTNSVQVNQLAGFQVYWQVATAPWRQRKTEKSYWGLVAIAVMIGLLGVLFAVIGQSSSKAMWVGASLCESLLICCVWGIEMGGMLLYNHPSHVLLVPGYLAAQRRVAVVLWLMLAGLQGFVVWLVASSVPTDAVPALLQHPYLACVAAAAVLAGIVMTIRWNWFFLALWVLGEVLFWYLRPLLDFVIASQSVLIDFPYVSGTAVLAVLGWLLAYVILRDGSPSHRKAYARRAQFRRLMKQDPTEKGLTTLMVGSKARTWLKPVYLPYVQYFQWQLKHPKSTPRSVMARLDLGIAGNKHWVLQLSNNVWLIALMGLALVFTNAIWGFGWEDVFKFGAVGGLMIGAAIGPPMDLYNSMLRSQRGQSLLVLLPGVPQGTKLNQALAKGHLLRLVLYWVVLAAILTVLPWDEGARTFSWLVWLAYMPMLPWALQDWSKVRVLTGVQVLFHALKYCGGLLVVALMHVYFNIPFGWIAIASVTAFALHTTWRWRKLVTYPQALPVGRLAL